MMYLKTLLNDTRGATAIEYGLLAALIAVGLIATITLIGSDLGNTMNQASNSL
jgi:pilus assembly protein Flp/PilA